MLVATGNSGSQWLPECEEKVRSEMHDTGGRATESKGSGGRVSRQKKNVLEKTQKRQGGSHQWVALCGVFPGRIMVGPPEQTLGAWSDKKRFRY